MKPKDLPVYKQKDKILEALENNQVIVVESKQGRGIVGVIDGFSPRGIEGADDIAWRKSFLRQIGYKL
jgi:adenosine/AMP kinase